MPGSDLAQEAAELLSIANTSGARSLNQLVVLAARQVAACTGATAVLWRSEETPVYAASHPDLPGLADVELSCGRGPAIDALAGGGPVSCPDMLEETRWPEYAGAALRCGVRCCVTLAYRPDGDAVTLSLFGARPALAGIGTARPRRAAHRLWRRGDGQRCRVRRRPAGRTASGRPRPSPARWWTRPRAC